MAEALRNVERLQSPSARPTLGTIEPLGDCEVCEDLKHNLLGASRWHLLHQHSGSRLSDIEASADDGCITCRLLYNGVVIFKDRWESGVSKENVYLKWHRTVDRGLVLAVYSKKPKSLASFMLRIEFFVPLGQISPWPGIPPTSFIEEDSGAETCLKILRDWLHTCTEGHSQCVQRSTTFLPDRVIEVLSDSGTDELKVVECFGTIGQYFALSHCWGTQHGATPPPKLLQNNMASLLIKIPWESLSKTLQDAVLVTRAMGARYLWIDSLCILQDDKDDWTIQAAKMSSIFSNAALTIVATRAADGSMGCFSQRKTARRILSHSDGKGSDVDVFGREASYHARYSTNFGPPSQEDIENCPLFERGWCLQERYLSTRMIHYGNEEMVWQCKESTNCECGGILKGISLSARLAWLSKIEDGDKSMEEQRELWKDIVRAHSGNKLTVQTDILPALSGLAGLMQSYGWGRYIAGVWERDLPYWLCWTLDAPGRRPESYTAPSFSWASTIGSMYYRYLSSDQFLDKFLIQVRDFQCQTKQEFPLGAVSGGFIRISGALIPATLEPSTGRVAWHMKAKYPCVASIPELGQVDMNTDIDTIEDVVSEITPIFCLPILQLHDREYGYEAESHILKHSFIALLLVQVSTNQYRRIGLSDCGFGPVPVSWLESRSTEVFSII